MKRNTLFSILATAALGLVMAGPASAANATWEGDKSANYGDGDNWSTDSVPGSGDTATINSVAIGNDYPVLDDANRSLGRLLLGNGATLTITGKTLTLDGTTTHDIDGEIHLASSGSDSVLKVTGDVTMDVAGKIVLQASNAVLDLDADVTVSGAGEIKGEHNDAEILIALGKTLTNQMLINGHLILKSDAGVGPGTFKNGSTGIVRANADGTLLLDDALILDDDAGAQWQVKSNNGAIMEFLEDATSLVGSFVIDNCAKLKVDGAAVETCGDLVTYTGFIDVENSGTFKYHTGSPCNATTEVIFSADDCNGNCDCP